MTYRRDRAQRTYQAKYDALLQSYAEAEESAANAWEVVRKLEEENSRLREELTALRREVKAVADCMDPEGAEPRH